jgi:hydrogenase maturation factor HypF (carbamoyltransferase family)
MIAVAYDGTGYGTDGTIWGGELLAVTDPACFTRVGHLRPFALPGGEGAVRLPGPHRPGPAAPGRHRLGRRPAAGGRRRPDGLHILAQQIPRGLGCVTTSSMGRLFDAVASLLGVCQEVTYEGQAAAELEHLARTGSPVTLDFAVAEGVLDPAPVIAGLVEGLRAAAGVADLAAGFHAAVIRATAAAAADRARAAGISVIGLTGGVFANRLLLQLPGRAHQGRLRGALAPHGALQRRRAGARPGHHRRRRDPDRTLRLNRKGVAYVPRNPRQGDRDLGGSGDPDVHRRLRRHHEDRVPGVSAGHGDR